MHFCPKGVLGISDELNRLGYYYVYPEAIDKCIACRMCEKHCPDFAIRVAGEKKEKKVRRSLKKSKR